MNPGVDDVHYFVLPYQLLKSHLPVDGYSLYAINLSHNQAKWPRKENKPSSSVPPVSPAGP